MRRTGIVLGSVAVVVLAVLGLHYGGLPWRHSEATPPPPEQTAPRDAAFPGTDGRETSPSSSRKPIRKHALLIGVTRYDHLPREKHLAGPANDVRLLRTLLEQQYQFPKEGIVCLTEEEGTPAQRPTRANIERAFLRLGEQAQAGDQVVILLAGHGSRQPESDPPDPQYPEPDGIDEVFLPADVRTGEGKPARVPNAIIDNEIGSWLRAITAKKAYVWIVFDCCHSGTMTRGTEVTRELPPGTLIPAAELERARQRAAQRGGKTPGPSSAKPAPFVPSELAGYLVAIYACRSHETTPECPQPPESSAAAYHGLLTYSLVDILTRSASSRAPLTYRELVQRLQVRYAGRPQGAPTPLVEGSGQDRVVLGTKQPRRSRLLLTRDREGYKVNAGDLYGLTPGSILAVDAPAGAEDRPQLLGHVRVLGTRPFDATVKPCAHEGSPLVKNLPSLSTCRPVLLDYGLRRFKVAVQAADEPAKDRQRLQKIVQAIASSPEGLVEYVEDLRQAEWLVRLEKGKVRLLEASGNAAPFALPELEDAGLGDALRHSLEKVYRARNLIALAGQLEGERYRGASDVGLEVEVLRHADTGAPGEVLHRPAQGWVFHPGDVISFRVHNKSASMRLDVTLLIVGTDLEIQAFYPKPGEVGKGLEPGRSLDTPPPHGQIGAEPPFGPEWLVVIATPAKNPPVDFTVLAQEGLPRARAADRSQSLQSPLGELLENALYRSGTRRGLPRSLAQKYGMRVLSWRTEAGKDRKP